MQVSLKVKCEIIYNSVCPSQTRASNEGQNLDTDEAVSLARYWQGFGLGK